MPDYPVVSRRAVLTAGVAAAGAAGWAAVTSRAVALAAPEGAVGDGPLPPTSTANAALVRRDTASADHIVFPADTYADQNVVAGRTYGFGIFDVRDFGAVGDGVTDDSDAIRAAINAVIDDVRAVRVNGGTSDPLASQRIIYFPNGTYLVSKILVYSAPWFDNKGGNDGTYEGLSWLRFRGESQANAVIRLVDSATAYNNASSPRPLISFSRSLLDGKSARNNVPASNFVENLTIDVGSNNPGAVGLLFEGANNGAVRNVTIRSSGADPVGTIGLWLPIEVTQFYGYNLDISGFATGISAESTEAAQISLEGISVTGYTDCAVSVTGSCVSLKGLSSSGPGPGVVVADRADGKTNLGVVSMLGCTLTGPGGTNSVPAVDLQSGGLHTRNQTVSGFGISIKNPQRGDVTGNITEYVSDDIVTLRTTDESSLGLWVDQTPLPAWDDNLDNWHSVNAEGALGDGYLTSEPAANGYELVYTNHGYQSVDGDDSVAIQKAMDSGKPNIYFRPGRTYLINETITIPSTVQRINFMFAQIVVGANLIQDPGNTGQWLDGGGDSGHPPTTAVQDEYAVFSVKGSSADAPLLIEDGFHQVVQGRYRFISHDSTRTLIVSDLHVSRGGLYRNRPHGGRVYLENVSNRSGKYHEGNPGFQFAGDESYPQLVWARHINAEHGNPEIVVNNAVLWALGIKKEDVGTMVECKNGGQVEIINAVAYNSGATIGANTPLVLNEDSSVSCTAGASYPNRNLDGLTPPFDWTTWVTESMDGTSLEAYGSDLPVRGTAQTYPDPTMRRLMLYVGRPSA